MLTILSPAKSLNFDPVETPVTQPRLLARSEKLVGTLRKQSAADLQELMSISEKLATLNAERYRNFSTPFTPDNAKPAGLAFDGDVYTGLEATAFDEADLDFAQRHLRILSGLYGVLRPRDLMQPYRLEMGTKLRQNGSKNLYEFWGDEITRLINEDLQASGESTILNLASQEYFKSIDTELLAGPVLTIHFKEKRKGQYKMITFNAKKARGRMAHLVVKERINTPEALKELVVNDYVYNQDLSTEWDWTYTLEA
jgi:cytoplasmic iron level regulating protein YaaA (DUF328/UPF0246 family)